MSDMMTFPDTWENFEKCYGFTDNEEVYTNGARLIPSFRVKQWLDHLPSVQPELSNNSPKLDNENGELISRQAAVEIVDRYNKSHMILKGKPMLGAASIVIELEELPSAQPDVPDTNVGELISRQAAIEALQGRK